MTAPSVPRAEASASEAFILRLGRALHAYGYPAHRLEAVLSRVARSLGTEAQFFSTPTSIFAAFGPQDVQRTHLIRVEPGEVHLEKLGRMDEIAGDVLRGSLTTAEGSRRIDDVLGAPARFGGIVRVLGFAGASGAAARFLGGGLAEVLVAFGLGTMIGVLAWRATKSRRIGRLFEPLAAFLASLIAALMAALTGPYSVMTATLAGLIVLLPGFTMTTALRELSARHLVSGTARLSGAFVVFLSIGLGVAMGNTVAAMILPLPDAAAPVPLPLWTEWAALLVAPLSFTVLLKARPRDLPWIVIVGILTFVGGRIGARVLGPELGVFAGALTAGVAANAYARFLNRPASITLVPAILLLVPGSIGFRSLVSLLNSDVVQGMETAFRMILMVAALVAGLLMANVVLSPRRLFD